jgi:hypothetical protein
MAGLISAKLARGAAVGGGISPTYLIGFLWLPVQAERLTK